MSPKFVPATVAELAHVGLLAELPGETLRRVAARMRREDVPAGKGVILEGEEGDRFYVILTGLFAVSNKGALGPRRVLRPGSYFGEVALAMDVPRTASVTALTPSVVASCDRETFDELIRPLFADDPAPSRGSSPPPER
jgi:ATP-binding cassette, subfamily B, bacterial